MYIDLTNVPMISPKKIDNFVLLKKLKLNFFQRAYIDTWTCMIFYKAVVET